MRIPRVFYDGALEVGACVDLNKDQAHYLGRVLRLKPAQNVVLFNGQGGEHLCEVSELDSKSGRISIQSFRDTDAESPIDICLALGLSKGDRFDWAIQKATELGVTTIQPLFTQRSEVRLAGNRQEKKLVHWRGIARSATEQSGRTRIPDLLLPRSIGEYLAEGVEDCKLILDPNVSSSLIDDEQLQKGVSSISVMVGPEGGFEEQEVAHANNHGYRSVHIGPRVLRTETAPIAALAVIQATAGGW